jgi:thiamine biosynthesis lipoprotein
VFGKRRSRLALLFALLVLTAAGQSNAQRVTDARNLMGSRFSIVVEAPPGEEAAARRAMDAAFHRIEDLEDIFSDHDPDSEVSRLVASQGGEVSEDLLKLLLTSREIHQKTKGAFDVTVGNLTRLWRRTMRRGSLPTTAEINSASQASGWGLVKIDGSALTLEAGVRLDFGAVAKGFAADEAVLSLQQAGFPVALVDAGGDVSMGDPPPDGWKIEFPDGTTRTFYQGAVATSGDHYRHVEVGGERYSHVLDPATGMGMTDRRTTTVIATNGTWADALASAFSVLPLAHCGPMANALSVSVHIQRPDGVTQYLPTS